jgi:hypothetical protein
MLYVTLDRTTLDRLRELAARERRRPQDQAAVILEKALIIAMARSPATDEEDPNNDESE